MTPAIIIAGVYSSPGPEGVPPAELDEYVLLVNVGDEPANLRGWSLTNRKEDQVHHYRYLFPRFLSNGDPWELAPGGMILLYTGRGTNGCTATAGEAHQVHLYQHRGGRVWQDPGDTACLYDRAGALVSEFELPWVWWAV
jgi:hypothetical protein